MKLTLTKGVMSPDDLGMIMLLYIIHRLVIRIIRAISRGLRIDPDPGFLI